MIAMPKVTMVQDCMSAVHTAIVDNIEGLTQELADEFLEFHAFEPHEITIVSYKGIPLLACGLRGNEFFIEVKETMKA